jgi:centrin-3
LLQVWNELPLALQVAMRALGFPVKKDDVRKLMQEYDKAASGKIDYDAFMEIMTERYLARDPDEEIQKAFRLFDEDGTGKITLKNLRRVARELGENLSDDELGAMIEEFDRGGQGAITLEDFFYIMKSSSLY